MAGMTGPADRAPNPLYPRLRILFWLLLAEEILVPLGLGLVGTGLLSIVGWEDRATLRAVNAVTIICGAVLQALVVWGILGLTRALQPGSRRWLHLAATLGLLAAVVDGLGAVGHATASITTPTMTLWGYLRLADPLHRVFLLLGIRLLHPMPPWWIWLWRVALIATAVPALALVLVHLPAEAGALFIAPLAMLGAAGPFVRVTLVGLLASATRQASATAAEAAKAPEQASVRPDDDAAPQPVDDAAPRPVDELRAPLMRLFWGLLALGVAATWSSQIATLAGGLALAGFAVIVVVLLVRLARQLPGPAARLSSRWAAICLALGGTIELMRIGWHDPWWEVAALALRALSYGLLVAALRRVTTLPGWWQTVRRIALVVFVLAPLGRTLYILQASGETPPMLSAMVFLTASIGAVPLLLLLVGGVVLALRPSGGEDRP